MKRVLISGISGQDGYFLTRYLLKAKYQIIGLTRQAELATQNNCNDQSIGLIIEHTDYSVGSLVNLILTYSPDYIVNLAGQSSVGRSWEILLETVQSQGILVINFLHAITLTSDKIYFYNASSSEIFATDQLPIHEESPLKAYNPYGCAQSLGHQMVDIYREYKGFRASNVILFPHESIRRSSYFVFRKLIRTSVEIARGTRDILELGNLAISRDWGSSEEYMQAIYLMINSSLVGNISLCSSEYTSLQRLVERAFLNLNLDWRKHVKINKGFVRYNEPLISFGSNSKAKEILDWSPVLRNESLLDYIQNQELML